MKKGFYILVLGGIFTAFSAGANEDIDADLMQQFMAAGSGTESVPVSSGLMDAEDLDFSESEDVSENEMSPLPKIPQVQKSSSSPLKKNAVSKPEDITISKGETLTDALQKQTPEKMPIIPLPDVKGTWVDTLAHSVPRHIKNGDDDGEEAVEESSAEPENLQNMMNQTKSQGRNTRSNASVFDISGIMLRMTPAQAEKAMMMRGFKKIAQSYDIPNFIRWRNEEACRNNGVVGYERLNNCVVEIAKKNNHQYVSEVKYSKFSTKEEIEIKLTSNFTNNKIYQIRYKSLSGRIIGSGAKAAYLRNIKVYDFWKKVNQKYGAPDDKEEIIWGLGGNQPYMRGATGFLMLEDAMLRELDYTRMSREDQRFMNTDLYSF